MSTASSRSRRCSSPGADPALHGAFGFPEHGRDLAVRIAAVVRELDGLALALGEQIGHDPLTGRRRGSMTSPRCGRPGGVDARGVAMLPPAAGLSPRRASIERPWVLDQEVGDRRERAPASASKRSGAAPTSAGTPPAAPPRRAQTPRAGPAGRPGTHGVEWRRYAASSAPPTGPRRSRVTRSASPTESDRGGLPRRSVRARRPPRVTRWLGPLLGDGPTQSRAASPRASARWWYVKNGLCSKAWVSSARAGIDLAVGFEHRGHVVVQRGVRSWRAARPDRRRASPRRDRPHATASTPWRRPRGCSQGRASNPRRARSTASAEPEGWVARSVSKNHDLEVGHLFRGLRASVRLPHELVRARRGRGLAGERLEIAEQA